LHLFFFFQAEDGIRDPLVTGVQTCALPISPLSRGQAPGPHGPEPPVGPRPRSSITGPWPRPVRPRLPGRLAYRLQRVLAPNAAYRGLAGALARAPAALRAFTAAEKVTKGAAFGCRMCGQCTLPVTGYACPETCPKQLR